MILPQQKKQEQWETYAAVFTTGAQVALRRSVSLVGRSAIGNDTVGHAGTAIKGALVEMTMKDDGWLPGSGQDTHTATSQLYTTSSWKEKGRVTAVNRDTLAQTPSIGKRGKKSPAKFCPAAVCVMRGIASNSPDGIHGSRQLW